MTPRPFTGRAHLLPEYAVQNFSDNQHGTDGNSQATQAQINSFMTTTLSWMDNQSWIERYFWFGAMYEMVSAVL